MSGGGGTGVQAARDAGGVEDTESQRGSNNVQHGPEEADQVVPEDVPGVPDVPDVPEDVPEHDDQDVQHGLEEADQDVPEDVPGVPDVPEDVPEDDDQDVHHGPEEADQDVQLGSYRTVSYQKEKVSSSENTTLFKRNQ